MNSVYRLRSDELTPEFIAVLKKSYPHKEIEITVDEVVDETEYLMSTSANRVHLENAISNIEQHTNLEIMELPGKAGTVPYHKAQTLR